MDGNGQEAWRHGGAFLLGAVSTVAMVAGVDIGITVLANGEPHGIPKAIAAQFVDILQTGEIRRDWLYLALKTFDAYYINPGEPADKNPPIGSILPERWSAMPALATRYAGSACTLCATT